MPTQQWNLHLLMGMRGGAQEAECGGALGEELPHASLVTTAPEPVLQKERRAEAVHLLPVPTLHLGVARPAALGLCAPWGRHGKWDLGCWGGLQGAKAQSRGPGLSAHRPLQAPCSPDPGYLILSPAGTSARPGI